MRLLQLCREPRLYSCQRLKQAAEKAGYAMDILDPNRFLLCLGESGLTRAFYQAGNASSNQQTVLDIEKYDGVIGRFGTASTAMGCRVLRYFEQQNIACLNSAAAFETARDKWLSLQQLSAVNIPIPYSAFAGELVSSDALHTKLAPPCVIKTLSGSQGTGVMLAESRSTAQSILATLNSAKITTLSQDFIQEAQGQDIRAFVIGNEVVASMQRQGKAGDFRANIHQGGLAEAIPLSSEEKALAIKATQTIGLDVAGVDLIRGKQGIMVLEVNASPGLEMIEQVSGVKIAEKMIDYLLCKKIVKNNRL